MFFNKLKILFILLLVSIAVKGQKINIKIDSLKNIVNTSQEKSVIANAKINIGKLYNNTNTDSAMVYFKSGLEIAEENNFIKYKVKAFSSMAASYIMKGELDSSEVYFDKAKVLLPKFDDKIIIISYYGDRGILEYYKGDLQKASENFKKALDISIEEQNIENIIRYSNNSALTLSKIGKNNESLDIYYKALKAAEEQKDSVHIGMLLNNIANVYEDLGEGEKALELYQKSLTIKIKNNSYIPIITGYFNIASTQLDLSEKKNDSLLFELAKINYDSVLKLSKKTKYGNGVFMGLEGLGKIELQKKNYQKSKEYFLEILKLTTATPNKPYENMAKLSLGEIEVVDENYSKAKEYLFSVKDFVEKSGTYTQKRQLAISLSRCYLFEKNYKKAYEYLLADKELQESATSDQIKDKISNYEVKYETEKKEKEIAIQRQELLDQELQIKNRNLSITLVSAILIIIIIISFGLYRRQQFKRNQLQKELDLKDALTKIKTQNKLQEQRLEISRDLHDNIGSQLTFIISSIDNLKYISKDLNQQLKDKLSGISSFTFDTIHQLRDTIWTMNKNEITIDEFHTRIVSYVEKAKTVKPEINFDIQNNTTSSITFTSVIGMNLFRVTQEAINNSIKHSEASKIMIIFKENENEISLQIEDNGKGFDKENFTSGNGLSNIENRISSIKGEVYIESKPTNGTSIKIQIKK